MAFLFDVKKSKDQSTDLQRKFTTLNNSFKNINKNGIMELCLSYRNKVKNASLIIQISFSDINLVLYILYFV